MVRMSSADRSSSCMEVVSSIFPTSESIILGIRLRASKVSDMFSTPSLHVATAMPRWRSVTGSLGSTGHPIVIVLNRCVIDQTRGGEVFLGASRTGVEGQDRQGAAAGPGPAVL